MLGSFTCGHEFSLSDDELSGMVRELAPICWLNHDLRELVRWNAQLPATVRPHVEGVFLAPHLGVNLGERRRLLPGL